MFYYQSSLEFVIVSEMRYTMFRKSLVVSIILHVIFLIGMDLILSNNTVSKAVAIDHKTPIYLELAMEPAGVDDAAVVRKEVKRRQPKGPSKQPSGSKGKKAVFPVVAELQAPPLKTVAAKPEKRVVELQPPQEQRPEEPVKTDAIPVVEAKPQRTPAPVAEERPLISTPPLSKGLGEPVKPEPEFRPAVAAKNPDTRPASGLKAPPLDASLARGPGGSVKPESGPGGKVKNPGSGLGAGGADDSEFGGNGPGSSNPGWERKSRIYAPSPVYPLQAQRNNWEGVVLLEIRIGTNGRVQKVAVVQSSGYPVLDRAATKTIRKWRYRPAQKNGVAITSETRVRIKFVLRDLEG
jgi:protein TonB